MSSEGATPAGFVIEAERVPILPGALAYAAAGYVARGASFNPGHFGPHVHFAGSVPPDLRTLLWESETSGGLLLAVPAATVGVFEQACREAGQPAWRIGEVVGEKGIQVV